MSSAPPKHRQNRTMLDQLLGVSPEAPAVSPQETPAPAELASPDIQRPAGAALRLTVNVPAAVIERARNAVYHSPGLTLGALCAAALRREIDLLEQERGSPFPTGRGALRVGRPIR